MTIQNANICAAAGKLSAGGVCSRLTTSDTNDLSFSEMIDMLEAQPERTCVSVPGFNICADDQSKGTPVTLPSRGAGILMSSADFGVLITELREACRRLGGNCSYATRQVIANWSYLIKRRNL